MSTKATRQHANQVVDAMQARAFTPATIINCGVGSCPEQIVWRRQMPDAHLVGIDSRANRRKLFRGQEYIKACLGAVNGAAAEYCSAVRSLKCHVGWPGCNGRHFAVKIATLDALAADRRWEPPYFIWMDIEGSEMDALLGAMVALAATGWINVECRNYEWDSGYADRLHNLVEHCGFALVPTEAFTEDRLYWRR